MSCPSPLPTLGSLYVYSDNNGFSAPNFGQQSSVQFCGSVELLTPGSTISLVSGPGASQRFSYKIISVSSVSAGKYTVIIENTGLAPNGVGFIAGPLRWSVGIHRSFEEDCSIIPERDSITHLLGVGGLDQCQCPPDPHPSCLSKFPIEEGYLRFVEDPNNPGAFLPTFDNDFANGVVNSNLTFNGATTFNGAATFNNNLCNPYALSQPVDPNAQAIGVNASGCLRRIPLQRFVFDRRYIGEIVNTTSNDVSGTLTITGVPTGATHVALRVAMSSIPGLGHWGFYFLIGPNTPPPLTVNDIIGIHNYDAGGSDLGFSAQSGIIALANAPAQLKWRATTNAVPPHPTLWANVGASIPLQVTVFIDGFYVTQ